MENIIEQIFEPQFRQISLRPVSGNNQIKGSGITYRPAPDVGEGYYWVQPIRDLCAVTIADLTFKKEVELNYEHPSFLAVGNYAPPLVPHFQGNTVASYSAGVYGQKIIWSVISTTPQGFVLEYPRAVQCVAYL